MTFVHPFFVRLQVTILALGFASIAFAGSPLIDARLSVALIQSNGNFETTGPATAAKPGDILEYTAHYSNRGNAAADALSPTMPVPVGTEYLPTIALPKPTHASLDNVTFAPIPLRRKQIGLDGKPHEVDVPFVEYRALRWTLGSLGAGNEVVVQARVRIPVPSVVANR